MIKLCIFDLDGTLVNSLPAISHYANTALAKNGFPAHSEDKYKTFVGDGAAKLVHRMLGENDTDENYKAVRADYDRLYEADVLYNTQPYDGICALLDKLKADNVKIAVLSNKPHNVTEMIVEKLFGNRFDICFGQRDGIEKKPAPDGVFEICRIMNIKPCECVFVGDTNVDILTGKNAQVSTIGVLWGFRDRAELTTAEADRIVSDAGEIYDIVKKENSENE